VHRRDAASLRPHALCTACLCWCPQVSAGLVHCHSLGVWHLDVKPDNVLVSPEGQVKLTDFGCAATTQTTTQRCGTLDYACPEALRGVPVPVPMALRLPTSASPRAGDAEAGPGRGGPWDVDGAAPVADGGVSAAWCVHAQACLRPR
jgi:serine/threonine protein kinase